MRFKVKVCLFVSSGLQAISFKACGISCLGAGKQLEVKLSQLLLPQGKSINEVQGKVMFVCFIWGSGS